LRSKQRQQNTKHCTAVSGTLLCASEIQNLLILDEAEENGLDNTRISVLTAKSGAVLQGIAAELQLSYYPLESLPTLAWRR
jgi:hypothetical protein